MSESRRNFLDSLIVSGRDAFTFKNLIKRILYFLFFAVVLSLPTLIKSLDKVGQSGGNAFEYFRALMSSIWHGVGVSLASLWSFFTQWSLYIDNHAWGSLVIGMIMVLAVIGFFYQPISLIINFFDGQGRAETGDSAGNATGAIVRLIFTLVIVIILSSIVFYTGISDPILTDLKNTEDKPQIDPGEINNTTVEVNETSITNSINMLTGG